MKVSELILELKKWRKDLEVVIAYKGEDIKFYKNGIYEDCQKLIIDVGEKPQIPLKQIDIDDDEATRFCEKAAKMLECTVDELTRDLIVDYILLTNLSFQQKPKQKRPK